jgi:acetate kinase
MREILAPVKRANSRAKLAFDIYVHRLLAGIGAMIAVLGGIDVLVFSAGVGENSAQVRDAACKPTHNVHPDTDIATPDSAVRVLIIRAQEDWAIARECWQLKQRSPN